MLDKDMIKEVFTKRLNYFMEIHRTPQNELAKYMNVSNTTVNSWVKGYKTPRMDKIDRICSFFGINRNDLLNDISDIKNKGVKIPVLGKVIAGIPIEAITDIIDYEEIQPSLARTGDFFALQIKGNSMEPKLYEGDTVIVKCASCVESGDTAIVLINGNDATVKQVKISKNGIMLIGHNVSAYEPHFYSTDEIESLPIQILGKVIELRRKL